MPRPRPILDSLWFRYGFALAATAAALLLRLALNPVLGDGSRSLFFTFSLLASAYVAGALPTLVAAVLGAAAAGYFWSPRFLFSPGDPRLWVNLFVLLALATIFILLAEMLRRAHDRATANAFALQQLEPSSRNTPTSPTDDAAPSDEMADADLYSAAASDERGMS